MVKKILLGIILSFYSLCFANETIEIIIPNSPGGPTDYIGRKISKSLTENNINNIVVNKGGAAGNIGYEYFSNCKKPCLLIAGPSVLTNRKYTSLGYPDKIELDPMYLIGIGYNVLLTSNLSINNFSDLVKLSKAKKLFIGHGGIGSNSHSSAVKVCEFINCELISYKSASAALPDLYSGRLDLYPIQAFGIDKIILSELVKPVAVLGPRMDSISIIPSINEQGYKIDSKSWLIIFQKNIKNKEVLVKNLDTIDFKSAGLIKFNTDITGFWINELDNN